MEVIVVALRRAPGKVASPGCHQSKAESGNANTTLTLPTQHGGRRWLQQWQSRVPPVLSSSRNDDLGRSPSRARSHLHDRIWSALPTLFKHINLTFPADQDVSPDEVTQADFDSYISAAADAISPLDYEIRSTQNQLTKERVWALVNSVSDPLTQMATTRTTEEIFYIRRFLDAMFETYNTKRKEVMAMTSMQASETKIRKGGGRQSEGGEGTQAQAHDKGLTVDEVEKLLASLVQEKWIMRSREGYYTLTPRALMELRSWLVDSYNEPDEPENPEQEQWQRIKFCEACKEIVTIGQRCSDLDCHVRLHNICEAAYFASRPAKVCPKCESAWDGKRFVGEKAVTTTEEYLKGKRRSGVSKRKAPVEDEGEDGEEEEEEATPAPPRRRSRREEPGPSESDDEE